jgi:hypothetical protein
MQAKGFDMAMRTFPGSATALIIVAALLGACGGEAPPATTSMPAAPSGPASAPAPTTDVTVSGVGFVTPESVLHDPQADVYLVSNINGMPLDKDDNGFISRVSPAGELLELKWIDGAAANVTLNAPKGLAIDGGRLYVADIDCVRIFDRTSGAPDGEVCIDGASFLNDVAPANGGGVLVTDSGLDANFGPSGTDAVYRIRDGAVETVAADSSMGAPNGVIDTSTGPLVVTFMSGEIYRIGADGTRTVLAGPSQQQLDGIVQLADGRVLASSWGDSCIYALSAGGAMECVVANVEAPADIGVDLERSRVLIPLFNANAVRIQFVP